MSPTYEQAPRFRRDVRGLRPEQRRRFQAAVRQLVAGLQHQPPELPTGLRVKRVQGTQDVWEMTFAPDGRATFRYGPARRAGEPHVVWLRVGTHAILDEPQ
jgi:hypothetical protein